MKGGNRVRTLWDWIWVILVVIVLGAAIHTRHISRQPVTSQECKEDTEC